MPKQETELTLVEPAEGQAGATAEEQGNASAPGTEPAGAKAGGEVSESQSEPVSRVEFDKLKTERDQLLDRLRAVEETGRSFGDDEYEISTGEDDVAFIVHLRVE